MNLYDLLDGLVSDEGRNKLMSGYYNGGHGEMSPSRFEAFCQEINKNKEGNLRVITREGGVYIGKKESGESTGYCLRIIGKSIGMKEEEINQKIEEINSSPEEPFYFTKPAAARTPLDERLAELEKSARYDKAAEILLKKGDIERAKLYSAAQALVESVPIPWYAD